MKKLLHRAAPICAAMTMAVATFAFSSNAEAQTTGARQGGFLSDLFGGNDSGRRSAPEHVAQLSESDLVVRLNRLENQIRQLTGAIEQLQFHNQQLEQALQKTQAENEYRFQELGGKAHPNGPSPAAHDAARPSYPAGSIAAPPPAHRERRSDVFDPAQHPDAIGTPRPLGGAALAGRSDTPAAAGPPVGIPGGREAGAPLDLASVSRPADAASVPREGSAGPSMLPPPPPRNPNATGALAAVQPPSQSPKDEYDLAFGYMLRKDYALAENAFRTFLRQHPNDRMVADATYWLGESLYQRQQYRDAAESFLAVTTKHEKSTKAPESLYRLGQSLAALGEKEAACAALGEVSRKYPRASASVKQGVTREQKRVHC